MSNEEKQPYVDKSICIGCSACVNVTEWKYFKLDDDGKAEAIFAPSYNKEEIDTAINFCPVKAISWREHYMDK